MASAPSRSTSGSRRTVLRGPALEAGGESRRQEGFQPLAGRRQVESDPKVGNYTTDAVDADVASVGPALRVARSYNSLDPRTSTSRSTRTRTTIGSSTE